MALGFISYNTKADREVKKFLKRASKVSSDLTPYLVTIAEEMRQSRKAIFELTGPGNYPDLNEKYKIQKQKDVGFIYPILRKSGKLERSITQEGGDHVAAIINKRTLRFGTKVEYAEYHQSDKDRKKIPLRKFLFIGEDETRSGLTRGLQRIMKAGNITLFREMGLTQAEAIKEANKVRYDT